MGRVIYDKFGVLKGVQYDFLTMNNKVDPAMLEIDKGEAAEIINMLPTSRGSVFTRNGYEKVVDQLVIGGWSNDRYAYCLTNSDLCLFDGSALFPLVPITPSPLWDFVTVNDIVVFSNGYEYYLLDGATAIQVGVPEEPFKSAPFPGTCLEFYNGRVYIARENVLYCTDSFTAEKMDLRFCIAFVGDSDITMVRRVDDGLYIATDREFFFLAGDDPFTTEGMKLELLAGVGVIRGTCVQTNGDAFPVAEMQGSLVIFATEEGIMVGGNGGSFKNLSFDKISYAHGDIGSACLHEQNGNVYYMVSFTVDQESRNRYTVPTFDVDIQEV